MKTGSKTLKPPALLDSLPVVSLASGGALSPALSPGLERRRQPAQAQQHQHQQHQLQHQQRLLRIDSDRRHHHHHHHHHSVDPPGGRTHNHDSHDHQHDRDGRHFHEHPHVYDDPHSHEGHSHGHHHDHHDHDHDHHHHHHHHHDHDSAPASAFPSLKTVTRNLSKSEERQLQWVAFHSCLGIATFLYGHGIESLVLVGVGYLQIYDALGVLNGLVSNVVRSHSEFKFPNVALPYSARRFEVLFAFGTSIYLFFSAMYMCKEGLEHLIVPHHRDDGHGSSIMWALLVVAVGLVATLYAAMRYENHRQLCNRE